MVVYYIRHGESESNLDGTHSGWSPVNLTPLGRAQAEATGKMLKDVHFDKLIVSDVRRAQQTADLVFPGMPRTYSTQVREMNNTTMRGKSFDEMYELKGDLYVSCREAFDYAPLEMDCESGAHLLARAKGFLDYLTTLDCERVAVVAHAGFIQATGACIIGLTNHSPKMLSCRNASVSVFTYKHDRWNITLWDLTPELP